MDNLTKTSELLFNENHLTYSEPEKMILDNEMMLFYNNLTAAQRIYKHIFHDKQYDYCTDKESPYIIDCGSNIGVSVLFFKSRYPNAKIICFEPDVRVFSILEQNIKHNNLADVKTINAAVANVEGMINFFGQLEAGSADSRGNSTIELWGSQRIENGSAQVPAVKLSNYIHSHVALLKLNISSLVVNSKIRSMMILHSGKDSCMAR